MTWNHAKNLLCVRLDSMGDVLMTTPAIRALREGVPGRKITLLTSRSGAEVGRLAPEIDEVWTYEAPWMKSSLPRNNGSRELEMAEKLRAHGFDAAVIFTVYSQSALPAAMLCYLADIPLRGAHCRENPYKLLTHWVSDKEPTTGIRHEVQRQIDLVAHLGYRSGRKELSLRIPNEAAQRIQTWMEDRDLIGNPKWIVVHPGATAASRRYPPEMFARVASILSQRGFRIFFTGSESERELVSEIRSQVIGESVSLAGELGLGDLAALIRRAPLLVSNNTGSVHIAAAVGTPVVDIYALTNPQHTPWQVPNKVLFHDVPCRYCYKSVCPEKHHHCLRKLSPMVVADAAVDLWKTTQENGDRP